MICVYLKGKGQKEKETRKVEKKFPSVLQMPAVAGVRLRPKLKLRSSVELSHVDDRNDTSAIGTASHL